MKYIVIVPDGMADRPLEALGEKTPLQVARTTNMDFMAQNGTVGLVQTIPDTMLPGSEVGNMAILGYDPARYLTGRAPIEAASMGIELNDQQVAFRCNLVTVHDQIMEDYSAGHISSQEAQTLIEALNQHLGQEGVQFYAGRSYRHLLILTVRQPEHYTSLKTTPPHDIMGQPIKGFLPQGPEAQHLLKYMEQSQQILESHDINQVRLDLKENPANMIWLWGQGGAIHLPAFKEKWGVAGAIISAVDLVQGIGRLAGLEVVDVPDITGYYDTNYLGKAQYALKALQNKDFVYIHIEAPDEASHNGDHQEKIKAIERVDQDIIGTILNHYNKYDDVRILVLPDHATPITLRTHSREPVGFVMYGGGIPQNGVERFDENTVKDKLNCASGEELLDRFINKYL